MVETGNEDAWIIAAFGKKGAGVSQPGLRTLASLALRRATIRGTTERAKPRAIYWARSDVDPKQPVPGGELMRAFRSFYRTIFVLAAAIACFAGRPAVAQDKPAQQ